MVGTKVIGRKGKREVIVDLICQKCIAFQLCCEMDKADNSVSIQRTSTYCYENKKTIRKLLIKGSDRMKCKMCKSIVVECPRCGVVYCPKCFLVEALPKDAPELKVGVE